MKKNLFLLFFIASGLCQQVAFAEEINTQNSSHVNLLETPFYKEVREKIIKDIQKSFHENKDELMTFLKQTEKYTEEEYLKLYNSYDVNPPFIEQNGIFELNPDYETKNVKYIEQNGQWIENPNYIENPSYQTKTVTNSNDIIPSIENKKRLGKKSLNINPDNFN